MKHGGHRWGGKVTGNCGVSRSNKVADDSYGLQKDWATKVIRHPWYEPRFVLTEKSEVDKLRVFFEVGLNRENAVLLYPGALARAAARPAKASKAVSERRIYISRVLGLTPRLYT